MAVAGGVCLRQLERFFQSEFHSTPRDWTRALRMTLARRLMERGYSTKAAANELFFCHAQHFCNEFTGYWGASPQAFTPGRIAFPRRKCRVSAPMSRSRNSKESKR